MAHDLLKEIEQGSKNAILKKKIITYYIYNGGSTIVDLSKELNLSVPTVAKFINEMCEDGYIKDYGKLETEGGRHPIMYGLNPESGYFVGVDIKNYCLDIGLVNFKGDMVDLKMNVPYKFDNTPESLDLLCETVRTFIQRVDKQEAEKILNICINIFGRVNPDSGYSYSFVNISWGLGLGIIIDGKMYVGKSGFSGEFGHINAFDNEVICHCGKKGCLETEASGLALHRILIERIKSGERSILSERVLNTSTPLTLDEIMEAIRREDLLCIDILEEIGQKLGKHVAGLINIFNPEMVVIGGTLSQTEDYIIQPIKTAVRKYSLNLVNKDTVIIASKLREKAGVVGACLMARSRMIEN